MFIKKIIERSMWFFPLFHIILMFTSLVNLINHITILNVLTLLLIVYLLPPILYRILSKIIPVTIGKSTLGPNQAPSGWMVAHRLQLTYHIFPFIEGILNSLPGIYTNWLRLWGCKIGRMVYWAPDVRVYDRTHLNIGDNTFIGGAMLSCHIGTPDGKGNTQLYFSPIKIGSNCFISTQCNIGPGSVINDKEYLKIMTQTLGNRRKEVI